VAYWRQQGVEPILYYNNPNIHPYSEYRHRLAVLEEMAATEGLRLITSNTYSLPSFFQAVMTVGAEFPARCRFCYRLRLEAAADMATELGVGSFTTTLLISPYQQHQELIAIGKEVAQQKGLFFAYADLRPLFRQSQQEARHRGYYRQKYCGCLFSNYESYK